MISLNKIFLKTLVQANQYSYYIHLKDHNKKINPQKNKLSLSYMNPKIVKQGAPQQQTYLFNLRKKTQKELQRKMFEEYKQKVLKGQIDQDQQIQVDPLWGEGQKPRHYFQNLSKVQLMSVSHTQNSEFQQLIRQIQGDYFKSSLTQTPNLDELKSMNPHELVNAGLYARNQQIQTSEFWFNLEKSFGNKFYELTIDELIKLNFSWKGKNKKGTPRLHQILNDLLEEDLNKMTQQQLIALFSSLQHSKTQGCELQEKVVAQLAEHYEKMNFNEKVNWLFTYSVCRKPQTYKRKHQKTPFELQSKAHQLIFNLNFNEDLTKELTVDSCVKLIYALAKLRANNTRFITNDVLAFLKENVDQICKDFNAAYKILYYSQELQAGAGIYDQEAFSKLISTLTDPTNFAHLNKYQQIKTLYAIWNYNLMTDDLFELYKNIQIEADSTMLHYFNQIELSRSSQREWQILRCTAQLQNIPLPYYQSFRRFCNYMKATTEWDLTPIEEKLKNTEYYFDVLRGKEKFYNVAVYRNLQKYLKFSGQKCPFEHSIPIENVQTAQFSYTKYQVSVDVVNESAFVPGTEELKESYRNKIRSLSNLGWKHVVLREKDVNQLPANEQIIQILYAYQPYLDEQIEVIQNRDYYRAEVIQSLRTQEYWDGMIAQEAQGYRNNPEEYAKKIAQLAEKEKKLSEQLAKQQV